VSLSTLRIPAPDAHAVSVRYSALPRAGDFAPDRWPHTAMTGTGDGWWALDLAALPLADGRYEYELVVEGPGARTVVVPDPYAEEITRFSGYRGVFRIRNGQRVRPEFAWDDELPPGGRLPGNHEIVVYELPMRWVDGGEEGLTRQVGLGTFDKAIFERLDASIAALGANCVELLPVQDSADTLNWGYGTRFFLAPDVDMGEPFDLRLFVRACHRRGIRVIMDLVMNHARKCPLRELAFDGYFLRGGAEEPDPNGDPRPDWGGDIFRYRHGAGLPRPARDFHLGVAEFLIKEYHVDGFRLDEFKGIDNYEFVQEFTDRAHAVHAAAFPGRPFIVIAEDSWRRTAITTDAAYRGHRVVDCLWDFDFRDEVRRLVTDRIVTRPGAPSRSARVRALVTTGRVDDLARHVTYCTSHDVGGDDEQRLFSYCLAAVQENPPAAGAGFEALAFEQVHSALALTLTAAGIPMFLAGEEFADLHDTDRRDWRHKMSDPVDWSRATLPGHRDLLARVRELVHLRTRHAALQRNEVAFFGFDGGGNAGFHPTFDGTDGERLFAYCRTAGQALGAGGQVVVVANCRAVDLPEVWVEWPWGFRPSLQERGGVGQAMPYVSGAAARLSLRPFQVRVFEV
jgi:pullulanase/glycogen debranching enzyme